MAFLRDFINKAKTACASVLDYCKDLGIKFFYLIQGNAKGGFLSGGIQKLIPWKKRLITFICGACGLAAAVGIGASLAGSAGKEDPSVQSEASFQFAIPSEEIFLPDEPDFIPGVLLGRERRTAWNSQDAAAFWQDPLKEGEEKWREKIETAVDEFLERIP
ncbi:MAG: hypothetical protein LBU82_08395 [Treponema sp.]|jgi:hypothetical protein|nr:hypothetical protein [Treponema sp.]